MSTQIIPLDMTYDAYLRDESRLRGHAESISFPTCESELLELIQTLRAADISITIQGGQTGIAGGAVAQGGHILNLSRMNHILDIHWDEDGTALLRAEAGLTMMELKQAAAAFSGRRRIYWPPEPTSLTATIGGAVATCAKGILSGTADGMYLEAARLVKEDGTVLPLVRSDGLLEQILGTEGLPGVFSELTLRLLPEAQDVWGICVFFDDFDSLCMFAETLSQQPPETLLAAEYLDAAALHLADTHRTTVVRLKSIPVFPAEEGAIYLELHGTESKIVEDADHLLETAMGCGCDDQQIWAVSGASEVERLRELRIVLQELVGMHYDGLPVGHVRLVTDMSFPQDRFRMTVQRYHCDAAASGLTCCVFGHILQNHLTACILPETPEAHADGISLLRHWADISLAQGGETVRSYGVGTLAKQLLMDRLPAGKLERCRHITAQLAPARIWNRAVMPDVP